MQAAKTPAVFPPRVFFYSLLAAPLQWRRGYAFPGSETDLLARGVIPGGSLGGLKAALLLRLLLAAGISKEQLPFEFASRCLARCGDAFAVGAE